MDDEECPRCRTSKYQNPSLVVMINLCGHSLCKECVELLFVKGSGNCVECGASLRRGDFRVKLFDDNKVEKEVEIRKKLIKDYYRTEEDFDSLEEYNDYLEAFERMVYNLANNIDAKETTEKIDRYKKENRDAVIRNRQKYQKMLDTLEEMAHEEKQWQMHKKMEIEEEESAAKKRKLLEKEALIDHLSTSKENAAAAILDYLKEVQAKEAEPIRKKRMPAIRLESGNGTANHFSSGMSFGTGSMFYKQVPKVEVGPLYQYKAPEVIIEGPQYPFEEEILSQGYMKFLRAQTPQETAAGFSMVTACYKILQEAMVGLYYNAKRSV